ncbi:M24 family metallopeptidase [Pseudoalteromonas peptidolytica]|uniref:Xaa-Pro dipeptidase n=1 Tax=Pseudoalteromonas peptidolytica F12-50-A1 TaxID=1315280 RepID=A0A8I0T3K3_9GAMM|nr:Xaa-Pro peptidase family protein [Pseudoalteromonas peptidolytica]MBE0346471.1 Xaa-Pro dipeptidase [Pseudoalteromonas peptidolytica F12-50-A1]NLR14589.1 aminopeptidase P family protein [Pseudoalteromonas peptidolytica]GEK11282.1 peptidase M24 [Pseudoalteromonas peptidolytica]
MQVNYSARQQRLIKKLQQHQSDALIVYGYENIVYLTGFTGHAATLLVRANGQHQLITDYRYFERAGNEAVGVEVVLRNRDEESLPNCIFRLLGKVRQVSFEAHHISHADFLSLNTSSKSQMLIAAPLWVESLRQVKDEYEIHCIQRAAEIADSALAHTLRFLKAGATEREVAIELEYQMQKLGSEGVAFDTILLFGARSSLPHGNPSNTKLNLGDLVLIDFGAVINGYRSDMTRSYVLGESNQQQQSMFEIVQAAQHAALELIKPGVNCSELNTASHQVLSNSPFAQYAGEGLGHGVGLFLHEQPFIKPGVDHQLEVGNIITIEPGIYIPNYGGIRLEEDVLVTESGSKCLTHAPQNFQLAS